MSVLYLGIAGIILAFVGLILYAVMDYRMTMNSARAEWDLYFR